MISVVGSSAPDGYISPLACFLLGFSVSYLFINYGIADTIPLCLSMQESLR
jgi:hypothetical protein